MSFDQSHGHPPLFRPQALNSRSGRLDGTVLLSQPVHAWLITGMMLAVIATAMFFLITGDYARKETVAGYVAPSQGAISVVVPAPGRITSVAVRDGDVVKRGAPLFTVSTDTVTENNQSSAAQAIEQLNEQRRQLEARLALEEEAGRLSLQHSKATATLLRRQLRELLDGQASQAQRIQLVEQQLQDTEALAASGYASKRDVLRVRAELLDVKRVHQSTAQQITSVRVNLTEAESAVNSAPVEVARRSAELRQQLAELDTRLIGVRRDSTIVVDAPVEGIASAIQAVPGQRAEPGISQLTLLPPGGDLFVVLLVPTRAAGFIKVGQRVRIMYDAFPYQRFGTYGATVIEVSRSAISAREVAGPLEVKEPVFRIRCKLDTPGINAFGEFVRVAPGMQLQADLVLEKRTAWEWLFEPLIASKRRAAG